MYVKIGSYRSRWISNVHTNYMNFKYGRCGWNDSQTKFEHLLEKLEGALQSFYNATINEILDKRSSQKIDVKIDEDDWNYKKYINSSDKGE